MVHTEQADGALPALELQPAGTLLLTLFVGEERRAERSRAY